MNFSCQLILIAFLSISFVTSREKFLQKSIFIQLGTGTLQPDIEIQIQSYPGAAITYEGGADDFSDQGGNTVFGGLQFFDDMGDDSGSSPMEMGMEIMGQLDELSLFAESVIASVEESMLREGSDPNLDRDVQILEGVRNIVHNLRSSEQVVLGGLNLFSEITNQMAANNEAEVFVVDENGNLVNVNQIQEEVEGIDGLQDQLNQEYVQINSLDQQSDEDQQYIVNYGVDEDDTQEDEREYNLNNENLDNVDGSDEDNNIDADDRIDYYQDEDNSEIENEDVQRQVGKNKFRNKKDKRNKDKKDKIDKNEGEMEIDNKDIDSNNQFNIWNNNTNNKETNADQNPYYNEEMKENLKLVGAGVAAFFVFFLIFKKYQSLLEHKRIERPHHAPDEYQAALNDRMRID